VGHDAGVRVGGQRRWEHPQRCGHRRLLRAYFCAVRRITRWPSHVTSHPPRSLASATRVKTQAKLLPWGPWHDPDLGRPIAAPLAQCAELLGVDLATVRELATNVEPYVRTDGSKVWSVMQLERQLRPEVGGRRGGYLDRRRTRQ
jgi:hypothetical protein